MKERCQHIMSKVFLYSLVILISFQTFERITFTQAALEYRDVTKTETNVWSGLLFSAFSIIIAASPRLAWKIGVQNMAKIGASISMFVAFCYWLLEVFTASENQYIKFVQVLAPFVGISDGMLMFSALAAFINTTPPSSRGWNFGLMFVCIAIALVLGVDHQGVLSSLGSMENTDEPTFIVMCFLFMAVSLVILVLNSFVDFQGILDTHGYMRDSFGGGKSMSHRWWRSLAITGVRWGCLVVTIFAFAVTYIKTQFIAELEENYSWDMSTIMNILLFGILGFLLACPIVGYFSDKLGSLKVMSAGSYTLAVSLLALSFIVDGEADYMTVGFVTTCFGVCSTPIVVMALISIQENLEDEYNRVSGSVTASLYLGCWMIGILFGLLLANEMANSSFQEMAFECSIIELTIGILASVLISLGILRQPLVTPLEKQLFAERKQKTPYVVENSWEVV